MIDDDDKEIEKANALFDEAIELYGDYKIKEAKAILSTILDKYTEYFEEWNIHEWLGLCYNHLDEHGVALFHLQKALAMYIDSEDKLDYLIILDNIGYAYYALYEYVQAIEYFDKASKYVNLYADTGRINELYIFHLIRGRSHLQIQRFNDAGNEFIAAKILLEQIPNTNEYSEELNLLNYELGRAYVCLRELDKAELFLKRVSLNDLAEEHRPYYHVHLGRLLYFRDKYVEAIREFLESERLGIEEQNRAEVFCITGICYYHTGDYVNAETYLTKALEYPIEYEWIKDQCNMFLQAINDLHKHP